MMLASLTGCSNAVYDDFQNFLNVEMVEVNANYDKLLEELAVWDTLEYDAEIAEFIKASLIPLVDDSLAINPCTSSLVTLSIFILPRLGMMWYCTVVSSLSKLACFRSFIRYIYIQPLHKIIFYS